VSDVLILEREALPATHASGRNAAIFRQVDRDPTNVEMAVASSRALASEAWSRDLIRTSGSLTIAARDALEALHSEYDTSRSAGVNVEMIDVAETVRRVPILARERIAGALWTPGDGVIDIHGLTSGLLAQARASGAKIRLGCEVARLLVHDGRVIGVATSANSEILAEVVVVAAGPWAAALGAESGGMSLPIRPMRRHLSILEPAMGVDPAWPVVWDISAPFYFRPESGGLLVSPCDQEDALPIVDPEIHERIWALAANVAPALAQARVRRTWACQRALTPDGRFILGEDCLLRGLFWVTGLGGHGMSAGFEAGRVAAELVHGRPSNYGARLAPERFQKSDDAYSPRSRWRRGDD
jgi:glycine/D-amino acid oxidase-like deaminating enzyme